MEIESDLILHLLKLKSEDGKKYVKEIGNLEIVMSDIMSSFNEIKK